jgi:hypothetical protein
MTDEMDIEGALKVLEFRLQAAEARLDEHQRSISILASRDDKIVHWQETHDWHHTVVPAPSARHHDIPAPSAEELEQADSRFLEATDRLNAENAALKARLALLEKKAALADEAALEYRWLVNPQQGSLHFRSDFISWLARYDALETSR